MIFMHEFRLGVMAVLALGLTTACNMKSSSDATVKAATDNQLTIANQLDGYVISHVRADGQGAGLKLATPLDYGATVQIAYPRTGNVELALQQKPDGVRVPEIDSELSAKKYIVSVNVLTMQNQVEKVKWIILKANDQNGSQKVVIAPGAGGGGGGDDSSGGGDDFNDPNARNAYGQQQGYVAPGNYYGNYGNGGGW